MSNLKEFKYMKKTDDVPEGYVYVPLIPRTTKAFINNIQVWDHRWWKNILCKINWFLHFKQRKAHKKLWERINHIIKYQSNERI